MTCIRRRESYWTTCTCDTCRRDRALARKRAYVGMEWRIPQETAWAMLAAKIDAGWTARALGSATGLDDDYFSLHVARHRRGETVAIGPVLCRRIAYMGDPTDGQIGAHGAVRRLKALARIGYGLNTLATETGLSFSTLGMVRNRDESKRVRASVHLAIRDTYDRLHMTPGPDKQARAQAAEKGWQPPLAWADDLDDPGATPYVQREANGRAYRGARARRKSQDLVDEWLHLRRCGVSLEHAAKQLGVRPATIEKALERAGKRVA